MLSHLNQMLELRETTNTPLIVGLREAIGHQKTPLLVLLGGYIDASLTL